MSGGAGRVFDPDLLDAFSALAAWRRDHFSHQAARPRLLAIPTRRT